MLLPKNFLGSENEAAILYILFDVRLELINRLTSRVIGAATSFFTILGN